VPVERIIENVITHENLINRNVDRIIEKPVPVDRVIEV
jgi:hypothetical protein